MKKAKAYSKFFQEEKTELFYFRQYLQIQTIPLIKKIVWDRKRSLSSVVPQISLHILKQHDLLESGC